MIEIAAALAVFASAPSWIVRTQTNLLGQPEAVAETHETPDAPGKYLKFSCSVMSGPVLEAGLGARSFEEFARFSADDAAKDVNIPLTLQYASALLAVTATPVAGNVTAYAYAVTGSDAIAAARAIEAAETIGIAAADRRTEFDVSGAAPAIGQVLDACPFKG
jgi:hypothetical protein